MLYHTAVNILDALRKGLRGIVIALHGKDGLAVQFIDLFEDLEIDVSQREDKIDRPTYVFIKMGLFVVRNDQNPAGECHHQAYLLLG
jgi:hypothetical protein